MGAWTVRKECDGCGRKKGQVPLRVYERKIPGFGKAIAFTFCEPCERLDRQGLRPFADPPAPTPHQIVAARPRPAPIRGPIALLPRLRLSG